MEVSSRKKKTSFQIEPIDDNPSTHKDVLNQDGEMKKHPVVTRVSLMFTPNDFKRDSTSSSSTLSNETRKAQQESMTWSTCGCYSPQRSQSSPRNLSYHRSVQPVTSDMRNASQKDDPHQKDNPRTLRLLLHQKDLEIKGLKNAAQRDPSNRLASILHEIVKPRSKQLPKIEDNLQKGEQENAQLEDIKNRYMKEIKVLEDKLIKSQLLIRHLQKTVKTLSVKSDDEADTESSSSADERAQIARESFELWSESGTKILPEISDLRLRRIPKHTSFVDAFHRFGSISTSEEEKDKLINEAESDHAVGDLLTEESSEDSLKTESKMCYEQSSLTVLVSQKSDLTSTDTKLSQSTWSLPSLADNIPPASSVDVVNSQNYWNYITSKPTLERLMDGAMWMPMDHDTSASSTEECKRYLMAPDSLKIVSVHCKGKYVRILNTLLNKEVDLTGYIIQQWIGGLPVSIYRFPCGTTLPAQYHITVRSRDISTSQFLVWAAGANLAHKQHPSTVDAQKFFKAGPNCTTILCDRNGQIVSRYVAPHRFSATAEAYDDNVDLSVDKFPLSEREEEPVELLPTKTKLPLLSATVERVSPSDAMLHKRHQKRLASSDSSASKMGNGRSIVIKKKSSDASTESSDDSSFSSKSLPPLPVKDSQSSSSQENYFSSLLWQPLLEERKKRRFKTTLDTTIPMVALIGQKSARSKYGFKYMTYIPITTDMPLRRYCPPC